MTISNRIAAADQRLLSRMTAADTQALDRATTGLGRVADHGVLWFALAAETKPALRIVKRPKKLLVYRPSAGD